jgi:hypothetical protein
MDKGLQFIQSCVRREINTDDLGYITKRYINNIDDIDNFFKVVLDECNNNFYDQPKTIKSILDYYIQLDDHTHDIDETDNINHDI